MKNNSCPIGQPKKFDKKGGLTGVFSGLIASLCCITPLVLIFLGIGSISFAFSFIGLKLYFLLASLLFLGTSFFLYLRRQKCGIITGLKSPFILTALVVHLILFIGSFYLLLPFVGPYVFEKRLSLTQNVPSHSSSSCHLQLKVVSKSFNALTCTSCEAALKYSLEQNSGVVVAEVDLNNSQVLVHYNKEEISSEIIIENIPSDFVVADKVDQCS